MATLTEQCGDTIAAPATSPHTAALAIMRLSGPKAIEIADRIWKGKSLSEAKSHTAHLGTITDSRGETLDNAIATIYRAPNSFTGEDCVELTTHGSTYISRELLTSLTKAGARLAQPGEFTRRAFLNARLDLTQAEAVADIIAAENKAAHRIAANQLNGIFSGKIKELRANLLEIASLLELELDFAEEDVEFASREKLTELAIQARDEITRLYKSFAAGNAIKNGITVTLAGPTNAGKSSLLNALLGHERAIVSPIHGTTRDTIEETINIGDHRFHITDTAGLRQTDDPIEKTGIDRTIQAIAKAQIIIYTIDASQTPYHEQLRQLPRTQQPGTHTIIALNKTDLPHPSIDTEELSAKFRQTPVIYISAKTGCGIQTLISQITGYADRLNENDGDILVANERHAIALSEAMTAINRVIDGLDTTLPPDLIAQSLRETIANLSAITGDIPSTEILTTIFSRFCIGK